MDKSRGVALSRVSVPVLSQNDGKTPFLMGVTSLVLYPFIELFNETVFWWVLKEIKEINELIFVFTGTFCVYLNERVSFCGDGPSGAVIRIRRKSKERIPPSGFSGP